MAKCKSCGSESPKLSSTSREETSGLCLKCMDKKTKELFKKGATGIANTIGGLFKK